MKRPRALFEALMRHVCDSGQIGDLARILKDDLQRDIRDVRWPGCVVMGGWTHAYRRIKRHMIKLERHDRFLVALDAVWNMYARRPLPNEDDYRYRPRTRP